MNNRLDMQPIRNLFDLEAIVRKKFSEAYGLADNAKKLASSANKKADEAKDVAKKPTHEAVFNALTEDGKCQGLFRSSDGKVYLNLEYVKAGTYTSTKDVFIEPGYSESIRIMKHITNKESIPDEELSLYDFDGDGSVTVADAMLALQADLGTVSVEKTFKKAKKTPVSITIDPSESNSIIKVKGTDIWGNSYDKSLGIRDPFLKSTNEGCMYRVIDPGNGVYEWVNPPMESGVEYRTAERFQGGVVCKKVFDVDFDPEETVKVVDTGISFYKYSIVGIDYVFDDSWNVFPQSGANVSFGRGQDNYTLTVSADMYGVCWITVSYK